MKHLVLVISMTLISFLALSQEQVEYEKLNPIMADLHLGEDDRLIEPTSPILGKSLAARIRYDKRHPELILKDLEVNYPSLYRDIELSSIAYFKILSEPLKQYCTTEQKEEANDKQIAQVETAAIPLEALMPLHNSYRDILAGLRENYVEKDDVLIRNIAKKTALDYQALRYDCNVVKYLSDMENKVKKYLPKRLDKLLDLHHKISSPEAAFPRIQFSINGFTQYVFNEIMKIPYERLAKILKINYDSQVKWIEDKESGKKTDQYFSAFEKKALKEGFLPREILLVLAYSTRNMPSLDVQYGYDSAKALLLETYFWKFHDHRDYVSKTYVPDIFPNARMKQNPGLYHYATSALMACDIRLHGYSGVMARLVTLFNKVGYKAHKLLGEVAGKDGKKPKLKEIIETAKRQAFGLGVSAAKHGGKYGLRLCRKHTPKEFWLKNNKESLQESDLSDVPSELDAEDLSPELERILE